MAPKGSGAGSPLSFQCWKCRRKKSRYDIEDEHGLWWAWNDKGRAHRVTLTGNSKNRPFARGTRHEATMLEYKCNDCGYQGWSSHGDIFVERDHQTETYGM